MTDSSPRSAGTGLVVTQLLLLIGLGIVAAPHYLRGTAPITAWIVGAASVALALWAVSANRPGNFNIRPIPHEHGQLIRSGPYRWIRHPMYSSMFLYAAACALSIATWWGWLAAAVLVLVLIFKARIEEDLMRIAHPDYAAYCEATKRFVPGLI